ncbi:hypothetical protein [Microbacterium pumilum]|uniref:SAM-dependent methyltransferase n=1 Tax=Microbacterium pumilum TaxID=344165 RepID=A0ABN2S6I6_9MICO
MNDEDVQGVLTRVADELAESTTRDRGVARGVTDAVASRRADGCAVAPGSTASRAIDGVTRDEAEALVRATVAAGTEARFTASRGPGVTFEPVDPGDRVFESSFNDHQRRIVGDQRLFGPDAVAAVIDLFHAAGWSVRVTDQQRVLDASDRRRAADWLQDRVGAAVAQRPALREWADEYLRTRSAQLADGSLRIVVHDADILAWSP